MPSNPLGLPVRLALSAAIHLYRLLLLAYPRGFRRRFGPEMVKVFVDRSFRELADRGFGSTLSYWTQTIADLALTAWAERAERSRRPAVSPKPSPLPPSPRPRKERARMFSELVSDLRHALRRLLRAPSFSIAAVVSLGLGIGASVAAYSVVDTVFLRPLPVEDPARLVTPGANIVTYPAYVDFRDRSRSFSGIAAWSSSGERMALRIGDRTELVNTVLVSGNYFGVLGVDTALGRTLVAADDDPDGQPAVAVIGHGLWQRLFGSDRGVLGQVVEVNGQPVTIVGVGPRGFQGERLNRVQEIWIPLALQPSLAVDARDRLSDRGAWWIRMMGRLRPGVSSAAALRELNAIGSQLAEEFPATDSEWQFEELHGAVRVATWSRHEEVVRFVAMLVAAVALALMVACANVASLLLSRFEGRRHEIGLRVALGAGRARIVRELVCESVLLALGGGAAGVAVAGWLLRLLASFELPGAIRIATLDLAIDAPLLAVALLLSVITALLFGIIPALVAASRPPRSVMVQAVPAHDRRAPFLRATFVTFQVGLTMVLLVGTGLFVRSLRSALAADLGFDARPVLVGTVDLGALGYSLDEARSFYRETVERLETLPGVESASWAHNVPVENRSWVFDVRRADVGPDEAEGIHVNFIWPGFFATIDLPLLRGRDLSEPTEATVAMEVVINDTLGGRLWPGEDPVGEAVYLDAAGPFEIVGVVSNSTVRDIGEAPLPYVYAPLALSDVALSSKRLVVRGLDRPSALALPGVVRDTVTTSGSRSSNRSGAAPGVPISGPIPWSEHVGAEVQTQQMGATLLGCFGATTLLLACVGVYGVVALGVSRRTREIGVRRALGAQRGDALRLALLGGLGPVLVGVAGGTVAALAASRLISSLLFGVSAGDPLTLIGTATLLVAAAGLAGLVPARRAARIHPVVALRES